jgi:very-short-patch-repair endonuclease
MSLEREIARAREMRKALTPPEARLWSRLKSLRQFGYSFRRQAPVLGYYLDFVCFKHRLIVEVDGQSHDVDSDALRDARLAQEGFRTLRYTNAMVRDQVEDVMDEILAFLSAPPSWGSSRAAGEGAVAPASEDRPK